MSHLAWVSRGGLLPTLMVPVPERTFSRWPFSVYCYELVSHFS